MNLTDVRIEDLTALAVLFYLIIYQTRSIMPMLKQIMEQYAIVTQVINNNTVAIQEVSKSNDNVATALRMIDREVSKTYTKVEEVEQEVTRIGERTKIRRKTDETDQL